MSSVPKSNVSLEEYFAMDDASPVKLEYYAGHVYAMAGALARHNAIAANATIEIGPQVRGRRCNIYTSDQRVRSGDGLFTYPDITVACQPRFLESNQRTLLNPVLIVEVLSDSTEMYDRTGKFESYQTIDSLVEYLLISSNRMHADLYRRDADGWRLISAGKPDEVIELTSCGCRFKLADVYANVEVPARQALLRAATPED